MSRKQATIRPEFIGSIYQDEKGTSYRLVDCQSEPYCIMRIIDGSGVGLEEQKPISEFAHLARLKPVLPRKSRVPTPRKQRKDKGTPRKQKAGSNTPKEGEQGTTTLGEIFPGIEKVM